MNGAGKPARLPGSGAQFKQPLWLGNEPVAGKTILLHAEQGFGDTIQFIRYAPLLAAQGAKVICEVQPELQPLLSQLARHHRGGCRRTAAGIRPALSVAQPSPGIRDAADDYPGGRSVSRCAGRARGCIGAIALPPGRPRAGFVWSGLADRTRTTPTDRSRSRALRRCLRIRRCDASVCRRELRDADREALRGLPKLMHLGDDHRRFRRYRGDHLAARCRDLGRYGGGASGRRARQAGHDPAALSRRISAGCGSATDSAVVSDARSCCGSRRSAIGTASSPACATS